MNKLFAGLRWLVGVELAFLAVSGYAMEVVVGQVAPMSGLDASQGRAYAAGLKLQFDAINKSGGINGHTFKLVQRDDGGRPEDTLKLTTALLNEDKPVVLAGFFGTRNLAELKSSGLLERERVALVGFRTTELQPDAPNTYNVRATLKDELTKIVDHLATIGIVRLGLLHEDGAGASAVIAAAEQAAQVAKSTIVQRASYDAGSARVTSAVDAFVKVQPQAIILVTSGAAAAAFIERYRGAGGAAQLFAHSGADIEQLSRRLSEEQMQGVAIAQVTPSPYRISTRLAKELNDLAKPGTTDVPVGYAMMEGFIAAKVIVQAIRRQGAKPTREGTLQALERLENLDLGGYAISFRPNVRNGSRFVELSIISSSGKIRQ